ncbi:neuraminidase-like domain-containing protein [Pseudomonas sp. NBRC 111124]|uniref:Tc toxin subunit A-related protein n=1 Tax=Pseudomonas sp. NBRC 111124 TaxID=1661039 RepID=UPI000760E331|nr:neuraminidase-like domain-containing protein [Pseudomonas sp. NBRC 111124]
MNTALNNQLAEQWRDALSAFSIHHVLPGVLQASALNMVTAEHLSKYLLLDTQVTSAVTTSYLAEALACVQTYINGIFNNIEPSYDAALPSALRTFWQQGMANYSIWAAYQMLEDYPENYIRPELRFDKTELFQGLENELAQGKITDAATQKALLSYLNGYEFQNSIRVQSGYIDYAGPQSDEGKFPGYTLANSDYYLLGHDAASPPKFYCRKAEVRVDQQSTFVQPDAWSEWKAISMPAAAQVVQARLVLFCGRLHLVWLQYEAPLEIEEGAKERYTFNVHLMYLGLDNQWSTPELLFSKDSDVKKGDDPLTDTDYRLLALAVGKTYGSDDQLYVAWVNGEDLIKDVQRDVLKRAVPADDAIDKEGRNGLLKVFEDPKGGLAFQRRITNAYVQPVTVKPQAGNDPYLSVDVLLEARDGATYTLRVRGRSTKVLPVPVPAAVYLSSGVQVDLGWVRADVLTGPSGTLLLRCTTVVKPLFEKLELQHEGKPVTSLLSTTFQKRIFGWYEAEVELTEFDMQLLSYKASNIRQGAGFTFRVDGSAPQALASQGNFIIGVALRMATRALAVTIGGTTFDAQSLTLNGSATSAWRGLLLDPETKSITVKFASDSESAQFEVGLGKMIDGGKPPTIAQQASGTDFLVVNLYEAVDKYRTVTSRLNSQHITDLINRAQASPQAVFAWDAQLLQEPAFDPKDVSTIYQGWQRADDDPKVEYFDANGLYLRELFFHVPHLIASRLQEEERFEDARRWLGLVFDPQRKQAATEQAGVDYWSCAWLLQDDTQAAGLEHQLVDPHVIALHAPSHYRKAVFMQQVQLLIGEADLLYRRQTRDSLANAWLLYNMAADLMGEAPNARAIDTWQPKPVDALLQSSRTGESRLLEHAHDVQPADLPKQLATFVWAGVSAHPAFRAPVNQQLLDTWGVLARRFHNLRHFLTLEGNPMQLPLYEPPANPFDLLLARMGGNASLAHLQGYRTVVPPYRFRTLVAKAQETVAILIQFGEQLRGFMEMEERIEQETLQFRHAAEIANYAIAMQQQLYQQQRKNHDVLSAQRAASELRRVHYQALYDENVSALEIAAMAVHGASSIATTVGSALTGAGYLMNTPPNVFGMANGGHRVGNPLIAAGTIAYAAGSIGELTAKNMQDTEMYRRRRQEWQLQYKLADKELQVLDKQLEAQQHATQAASAGLDHSRKALAQAEQMYAFYQNKSTSAALYRWLRSQASTWHATLFDVAVSLCNSAEACWQYETGNYDKRIIRTPVWQADRWGLNAGAELRLDLQRLEAEALLRNERHLEIRKTVSLQALLEDDEQLLFNKRGEPIKDWPALLAVLRADGELAFNLSQSLYDQDYPGHYMRRLHSVAVSLPALLGPYQNIRATLTQTQSSLLIRPDIEGVHFLTPKAQRNGDGSNVMMSLRPHQQVCLSTGSQDLGLVTAPEADDRYLPFEGTGAVSRWNLQFPLPEKQTQLLEGLSDIVLDIRYHALPGGAQFTREVQALLNQV